MNSHRLLIGDSLSMLKSLPDASVRCCVTSPPYWGLRDYGRPDQIGLEKTPEEFIAKLVTVFREVRRVLTKDGTIWVNIGDSYSNGRARKTGRNDSGGNRQKNNPKLPRGGSFRGGSRIFTGQDDGMKQKDLVGIPWMLAFALRADGWWLRQDIIWHKPNPMPESVTDRFTKAHEYLFLLSKSSRYYFDSAAVQEPIAQSSIDRLDQDIDNQEGSSRANGGTRADRPMKAVRGKQRWPSGWADPETSDHSAVGHNVPSRRRSGNKERKPGSARGCPEDSGSNVAGSVPWEGETRNKRSVWTITTVPFRGAHFATFPPELPEVCIRAGSAIGDTILDPFAGACTTMLVADRLGRNSIGIELNAEYAKLGDGRMYNDAPLFHNLTMENNTDGKG